MKKKNNKKLKIKNINIFITQKIKKIIKFFIIIKKNNIMYNYYFILINLSINIIKNININSSFQIKYYIFIIK